MSEKPVDRRIQKTRSLLFNALISLIIEKGYENITIQDIIDRANVGRSTFYSHFENKEQLLLSGRGNLLELVENNKNSGIKPSTGLDIDYQALFGHVVDQHDVVKAMIGKKGGDVVVRHLRDLVAYKIADYLVRRGKTEPEMVNILAEATAAALISLLSNWVEKDQPIPSEKMAAVAQMLVRKMVD